MHRLGHFIIIGFLALLLSACGTSTGSESKNEITSQSDPAEEKDTQNLKQEESKQYEIETEDQLPGNQTLSYTLNGVTKEETAVLTKSDNQDYSIYILPSYELTAEEPNKDSLFLKEDDHVFMRIELLPLDTDLNALKENTLAQLKVVNKEVKTITPPADDILKNATVLEAANDGKMVTAYLIEQKEAIVKLTLFTTEQSDHRDALLKMAKTIQVGKAAD
ncbi:hypothetical protein R4Z09_08390 [Niallia oryzisoli]|uniref:Lipoprotein n=1 Tax=Niallia oryzisoli TaxID=1737571 RepID=A0ABZ2CH05_9BACI